VTNLTETASFSRKSFIWVLRLVGVIIILILLISLGRVLKNTIFPPKPLPATVAFGKLPKPDLTEGIKPSAGITYKIETISGQLPTLPNTAKVFAIVANESSFGALERTRTIVSKLGFTQEPQKISGNIYKFQNTKEGGTITIDISSNNFILEGDYFNNPEIISTRPRSLEDAVDLAKDFFSNFDLVWEEFPKDRIQTSTLRLDAGQLTETPSLSSANLVRVNFQRASLDGLNIISPQEDRPPAQALVSERKVVEAELSKLSTAHNEFATYPLKGTAKAFEQITSGQGALNKRPTGANIPIRSVDLCYLETKNYQSYLQPVYAFKSDDGLIVYVAAVDDFWITAD